MKRNILLFLLFLLFHSVSAQYMTDILGGSFELRTINMPNDYEGSVINSLIKRSASTQTDKAILYIHGYNDYFFQREMAEVFNDSTFNFYAVDLRKYGRSLLSHQYPFQVRNLNEYFADIDTALHIMREEGNREIILMGHSTGGLITALYCDHNKTKLPVQGLILNSPFLDMNQSWFLEKIAIPLVSFYALINKNTKISQGKSTAYSESLLKEHHGEWFYDTSRKFESSPDVTSGWIRAIHRGQVKVHRGLDIPCPVLVIFSDKSIYGDKWTPAHQNGDAVLDVKDIAKYGRRLGPQITEVEVKNGLHDLVLSKKEVRDNVYKVIFRWLKKYNLN